MNWISRKWHIARQNPLAWWNVVLIGLCVSVIFIWPAPNASDFRVRTLGMVLQIVGVLTVWHDLTATARQFGRDGSIHRTLAWMKALIFGQGQTLTPVTADLVIGWGRPRVISRQRLSSELPIDERVKNLEVLASQLSREIDAAMMDIERGEQELIDKIKAEGSAREQALGDLKQSLVSATAGNYPVLLFGAWWLGIGVIIATLAPEIAKVVAGRWCEVWAVM